MLCRVDISIFMPQSYAKKTGYLVCRHEKMRYFCWCKNKEDRFDCLQPRKKMLKRRNRFLLLLSPLLAKEGVSPLKAERLVCCSPASRIVGSRVDSFFCAHTAGVHSLMRCRVELVFLCGLRFLLSLKTNLSRCLCWNALFVCRF